MFSNILVLCSDELIAPYQTPSLEELPLSALHECF